MKFKKFLVYLRKLFNLREDTDQEGSIKLIKTNVDFKSANAWTLIFAIFIASIGLNVNSAAVIIGAMLISPLMGPIVGIGFALGTYDFELLKRASRNLGLAMLISIATASIYFLISPLTSVQSELLARTTPTFFDVLVAFFGGAAGIIAISRRDKSNAIPGVAIATALMPPLCTAGFGLASGNLNYFFGALYLFIINSVFIAVSTFLFVRFMKFPKVIQLDDSNAKLLHRSMLGIIVVTLVPSLILVWFLQKESSFNIQAMKFIEREIIFDKTFLIDKKIAYKFKEPKIKLTLIGDLLSREEISKLKGKLETYDIPVDALEIRQTSLTERLKANYKEKISTEKALTHQLQEHLKDSERKLQEQMNSIERSKSLTYEVALFIPLVDEITVINNQVNVRWKKTPTKSDRSKVDTYLTSRLNIKKEAIGHSRNI